MKKAILTLIVLATLTSNAQIGGFLKDKVKQKTDNVVNKVDNAPQNLENKAKNEARNRMYSSLDNARKEFDASNFNYAISFIDNSGTFEADEKGNRIGGTVKNGQNFANDNTKSFEERAYTNNRNGELLMASNKYALAEQSFKLAIVNYSLANITSGLNYAQAISNLGLLYQSNGRLNKAKARNDKALELRKNESNKGMIAVSLNNKGVLLKDLGDYTGAEKLLKEAIDILQGDTNTNVSLALIHNNLAMVYADMAKLGNAETEMKTSIDLAAKELKDDASNFIKLEINQANIFRLQKKYTEAETLYLKAIKIKEKKLGAHPDLASLKRGLAALYMEMNKPAEVEKLLTSAVDINKKKLGEKNPSTLAAMQDLGNYYRINGNAAKSLELLNTVVQTKKVIYGEAHPNYIQALEDLALTQWQNAQIAEAKTNYNTVIGNTQTYINTFFNSLNENEKTLYWEKTNNRLHRYYSFVVSNYAKNPDLVTALYNTLINTKGFLLSNSSKIRNVISQSNDPELQTAYNDWLETKENLNAAYSLSKEEIAAEHINVDSLQNKANELERTLSQKSALFSESQNVKTLVTADISKNLGADEAAVEIEEINEYTSFFTGKSKYIALVVSSNSVSLVELGNSESIQTAIKDFRDKTINRKAENEAYALTWKLLDEKLGGYKKIYLALDGLYHQLSINALKDEKGAYLIDKYNIQFVGNTKDLINVKQNAAAAKKPASAFLIGNPTYGKNELIAQLPGTEAEVNNIKKILNASGVKNTVLIGDKATETEVKKINSPSVLHIATHGYFLADLSEVETNKVLGVDVAVAKQNPLLRSGVLLANCENVFDETYRSSEADNGILTAYEALSLHLDNTDMVVLSACETGLGSVKQGEGVFGLQRSFLIAGAKSIIMSLWSVSDEATMELMTLFYTNYSKSGNKQAAFAAAQKQLKTKYKEPFYWAAFVMLSK